MEIKFRRSHTKLLVWKRAIELVVLVYRTTEHFPRSESLGLVTQMRRAAVSIPSNIAEGAGRGSTKEFLRHLRIARGSLSELETQMFIAQELTLCIQPEITLSLCHQVSRLLSGLINRLNRADP